MNAVLQNPISSNELKLAIHYFYYVIAKEVEYVTEDSEMHEFGSLAIQAANRIRVLINNPHSRLVSWWVMRNTDGVLASKILINEIAYFIARYSREYESNTELHEFVEYINPSLAQLDQRYDEAGKMTGDAKIIYSSIGELLNKLPWPLKKLADVLMETLRLFSGNE